MPFRMPCVALAVGACFVASAATADEPASTDSTLQQLIDEALARSPELAAARHRETAARARLEQAGSLPGPAVGVFYENDGVRPSLGREPMTMLGLNGSQEIPYPGKRRLRRHVAEAEAAEVAVEVERARLQLVSRVKRAYSALVLARELAGVALEQRAVWDEIRETARVRQASATGTQMELLRAQVEMTRAQALHVQHHADARARQAEINALRAQPADTPVEAAAQIPIASEERTAEGVLAWSDAASPEIRAAEIALSRADRGVALARLESKPDFGVQAAVVNRGGLPPMWQAGASVMLPSRARARGIAVEAAATRQASVSRLEALRLTLRAVLEQRLAFLDAAEEIEATYREGLLPQAELAVESATATYTAGQGSQLAVLSAVAALLEDRTDYLRLRAAHAVERARLEEVSLDPPMDIGSLVTHGRSMSQGSAAAEMR